MNVHLLKSFMCSQFEMIFSAVSTLYFYYEVYMQLFKITDFSWFNCKPFTVHTVMTFLFRVHGKLTHDCMVAPQKLKLLFSQISFWPRNCPAVQQSCLCDNGNILRANKRKFMSFTSGTSQSHSEKLYVKQKFKKVYTLIEPFCAHGNTPCMGEGVNWNSPRKKDNFTPRKIDFYDVK